MSLDWLRRPTVLSVTMALCVLPVGVSWAEGPWSATIGATTEYVYRGVSQTYDSGALQLGGNYQSPMGWFAGAWGSNVNPYPHGGASAELDLYAGVTRPLGTDFSARLAYTHYAYLDDPRPAHYDYDELSFSVGYLDRLAATISYEPNNNMYSALGYPHRQPAGALEVTGRWPVWRSLSLIAGTGYYDLQRMFGVSYWAGNLGMSYVHQRLIVEVNRFFADETVRRLFEEQSANGAWTLSATLRF